MKQGLEQSEAKRKLASIQTVDKISPIPEADAIDVGRVLGWDVVIKKDEFQEGDKGVYFEIDSLMPPREEYLFLGKPKANPITAGSEGETIGIRLRTAKLRGQISQGLFFPFEKLNSEDSGLTKEELVEKLNSLEVGTDVSDLLGITKWERPEVIGNFGTSSSPFPSQYTSKTDEERIQNLPEAYSELLGESFYSSSKYDGTSITIIKDGDEIIIASRNLTLSPGNEIENFIKKTGLYSRLQEYGEDVVLQSEFYGVGIQDNRMGIVGRRLATFNIEKDGVRLGLLSMIRTAGELGLELPVIAEVGTSSEEERQAIKMEVDKVNESREKLSMPALAKLGNEDKLPPIVILSWSTDGFRYSPDELLEQVDDMKYLTNGKLQEGLVYRTLYDCDAWNPVSFKAISNKFLCKYD